MEFGCHSFPLPSFNPMRQKQRLAAHRSFQRLHYSSVRKGQSVGSQIANLKQFISAYFDSIQMICQAGSWLAETFSILLAESATKNIADEMKVTFNKMLQFSVSATMQAKNDLAFILLDLSLPTNHHVQNIRDSQLHNAKVLEKCIRCLSDVHNSLFKIEMNFDVGQQDDDEKEQPTSGLTAEGKVEYSEERIISYSAEWERLKEVECNVKSWRALKERSSQFLRKYNGLTETEIQNLVNRGTVSELYLEKLNQRIDTALRNYEVGLRNLSADSTTVFGGFHSSPDDAREALTGCCSGMEIEQGSQRLPVTQFLQCELPLMMMSVNGKEYSSNGHHSSANFNSKKNAIRMILQSCNQKLSISQTDNLASEILGDVCPARWRTHVKACLQLLFGNTGLVIMDTLSSETNTKQNAVISCKDSFIVVSITSIWCLKEDPGTMSLLQRNVDPEKTLATVNVRYVSIFNIKAQGNERFQPGVFVETFLQTGSQNRRRVSSLIRASQTLHGVPLSPMSTYWLTNKPMNHPSPILLERTICDGGNTGTTSAAAVTKPGSGTEIKRKKRLVLEVKEEDSSTEGDKSSDNEDSVKDVIQMLSGSRISTRKQYKLPIPSQEIDQMNDESDDKFVSEIPVEEFDASVQSRNLEEGEKTSTGELDGMLNLPGSTVPVIKQAEEILCPGEDAEPCCCISESSTAQSHKFKSQSLPGSFGSNHPKSFPLVISAPHVEKVSPLSFHHTPRKDGAAIGIGSSKNEHVEHCFGPNESSLNLTAACTTYQESLNSAAMLSHKQLELGSSQLSTNPWLRGVSCRGIPSPNQYLTTTDLNQSLLSLGTNAGGSSTRQPMMQQQKFGLSQNMEDISEQFCQAGQQPTTAFFNNVNMTQQNRNNNNVLLADRVTKRVVKSSQSHPHINYPSCVIGENVDNVDLEAHKKAGRYRPGVLPGFTVAQEQDQMHLAASDRSSDELIMSRFEENLGPIGSPIFKRHSKAEQSVGWHPLPSNTWPFSHDLRNIKTGESDYTQYVVEVTRNAMLRKQISKSSEGHQRITEDLLWDGNGHWLPPNTDQLFQKPSAALHKTYQNDLHKRCEHEDLKDVQAMKVNHDAARTGTWPPWQLWPTGNGPWN